MKALTYIEVDVDEFTDTASPIAETTYRFAQATDYLPRDIEAIPSLRSVSFSPARISLGENLGERASLSASFQDHRHIFNGEPFDSGTFWGKWRARYGTKLRGRAIRWIQGLLGQSLGEMETRHFVIESTDGPTLDGTYTINAKDVLKLADGDRAQAPLLSNGFIAGGVSDSDVSATLSPAGVGDAEYPSSGFGAIGGEEIVAFTRSGDDLSLTRSQLGTLAAAHDAGDRFQLVLRYVGEDPADIISDLLQTYAGVPASYIPLTAWQTETAAFLQRLYTATIAEPVSVNTLISELVEQAALAVWWEPATQQIRLQVLRAIATNAARFTQGNIIENSLAIKEQPKTRISEVWTYFGQRNPLQPIDEPNNFRSVALTPDLVAAAEYGGPAIKKIFSRWIPFGGRQVALRLNDIQLSRFRDPPRKFAFEVFRYGEIQPMLGGGYRLEAWPLQTVTGEQANAPLQVTRLDPRSDLYRIEAEEQLFEAVNPVDLVNRVIIIDADINSVNLRDLHDSIYPAPTGSESPGINVTCYIEQGAVVGSVFGNFAAAFEVGDWPMGIPITVYVRGTIQGKGGEGGPAFSDGEPGGTALYTRYPINLILNEGDGRLIAGGGGGGGGGASKSGPIVQEIRGGGGGGAGTLPGDGGDGGGGDDGQPGTTTIGGEGGDGGGDGGGQAQAGQNGIGNIVHGDGGAPGHAIDGVSFITKTGVGNITGNEVN